MTTAQNKAAAAAEGPTTNTAHPSLRELDRPVKLTGANAPGWGSDVVADTLRALGHPLYRAQSGRELSRAARLDRELSRQRDAADAALPARGGRGLDRARLRQGHRQGDGGSGALQCRAVPRHHGDLQCLVRPHAGRHPGRDRAGRCRQAPAVDRLDSHRRRPGRDRPQLHQVGRPAGLAGRRARVDPARALDRQHRADGAGLHQPRRRDAGEQARRAAAADRRQALSAARPSRRPIRSWCGRPRSSSSRRSTRSF